MTYVYAAKRSDGLVKVGRSKTPGLRVMYLSSRTKQKYSLIWMTPETPSVNEKAIHDSIKNFRVSSPGLGREHFSSSAIPYVMAFGKTAPIDETKSNPAIRVSAELHAAILQACPDGYKIRFFVERLLKGALAEEIKKQKAKK